ncbi:MAG: hypothetical protein BGP06_05060 [Rhizobiales bacterium 65-9]|nr:lipopolysaccharide biosynthesis protein [Hyphomicrobiales bacterium]OJY39254.1 MAG: hypothetical protein BGP06_05060 [Rhizobiales bacterium 65-9]
MLLRQTLLYMPAQLIGPLALFVAAVLWTHLLPPDAYGTLMLIMAAQELIFGFALSWLSLTVLRYRDTLEKGEGAARFRRAETGLLYGSILAQIAGVAILMPFLDRATPALILMTALYVVSRSLLNYLSERARAGGAIVSYTIAQTAGPTLGFALGLLLTRFFGASPTVAIAGYAVVQFAALPFVWAGSGASAVPGRPTKELLTPALRYGAPLLLSSIVTWISINGIRVVVEKMQGAVELGLLSVGWGLGQRVAATIAMLVTAAAFPLAVRSFNTGDRDGALDQLAQNAVLLVALLAPATVGVLLIDDQLVRLAVAEPYWATTIAILPYALLSGVARNVRMHYVDQLFLLHEQARWITALTVAEAAATIAGAVIGVMTHGLLGAAIGASLAHLVIALYVFAQGVTKLGLRVRWNDLARIGIATAAMGLGVKLLPVAATIMGVATAVAVGAAIYGAALLALFPDIAMRARRAARA